MKDDQETYAEVETIVTNSLPQLISKKKNIVAQMGEIAFTSEDTMHFFYFIMSGKIKISQINPDSSKEQITHLLSRGDMFDVVTLLDGEYHEYIATALEDSEILQVPIEHVRERINSDPEFNRFFFPYLGKQMRQIENLALDLSLYDVYHRLLRLMARNLDAQENGFDLKLINNLSHEELAALIGTVRKVLNRSLQKLKQEGIIDISRKKIILQDLDALFKELDE